jgi:transcriptional regulator of acetoin/glycerol metabolism
VRLLHDRRHEIPTAFHRVDCSAPERGLQRLEALADAGQLGGSLFFERVELLPARMQDRALRLIEWHGAQLRLIGASTDTNLREQVNEGVFDGDLYHYVAGSLVEMPDLRARRDEIPWLIRRALPSTVQVSSSLYYRAMLAPWRGGLRQLLGVVRSLSGSSSGATTLTDVSLEAAIADASRRELSH